MKFMFCILDYVGKHRIHVLSATKSFDTIVFTLNRLVGRIRQRSSEQKTVKFYLVLYFYYQELEQ